MKYMLLINHASVIGTTHLDEWSAEDLRASGTAMGLTGPGTAKIMTHDGTGVPVVTDGPFPETREFLAGYWLIDVESAGRTIEIAARTSAAPGPGGRPTAREIQVRPLMGATMEQ